MIVLILALLIGTTSAEAHGIGETWSSAATWTADPTILIPLYLVALTFLIGNNRLWRRAGLNRGISTWQVACFWLGWTTLALALLSPLHWLSERLLSAHMIEHELIMAVAAPLLVLSKPLPIFVWALPHRWRAAVSLPVIASVGRPFRWLTLPAVATVLHALTIWLWHAPPLFNAALSFEWIHIAQHVSFVIAALCFWWSALDGPHASGGTAALHLFATMLALKAGKHVYCEKPLTRTPTEARLLTEAGYRHVRSTVVDLFVNTSHVEVVTEFRRV
mgnify:CR=1 FL=1